MRVRSPVAPMMASLTVVLALGACSDAGARDRPGPDAWRGALLPVPIDRPDFRLTATDGSVFDFRRDTGGALVLLFFGYTNCPDICPVHMTNLAAVLRELPYAQRSRIRVVFVSTDPARDTPERIRDWLAAMDPSFIGLRGPLDTVNAVQRALGLPPAAAAPRSGDGYLVGHAAQILAFSPDGPARIAYPFGTRQADWQADLPRLLAGDDISATAPAAEASARPQHPMDAGR